MFTFEEIKACYERIGFKPCRHVSFMVSKKLCCPLAAYLVDKFNNGLELNMENLGTLINNKDYQNWVTDNQTFVNEFIDGFDSTVFSTDLSKNPNVQLGGNIRKQLQEIYGDF